MKKSLTPLAQTLRKNQTKEEARLWYQFLRRYPTQFRRQFPIGCYIVDFYCAQAKLIVELDGSQHYTTATIERDMLRTQYLTQQGLQVLRYTNTDIQFRFRAVCEDIHTHVTNRMSTCL